MPFSQRADTNTAIDVITSVNKGHMSTTEATMPKETGRAKNQKVLLHMKVDYTPKHPAIILQKKGYIDLPLSDTAHCTDNRPCTFSQSKCHSSTLENEIAFTFVVLQIHVLPEKYSCHPFCVICTHCPSKKFCILFKSL